MILYDIKYQFLIFFTVYVLDLRPQEPFPFDFVIAQEIAEQGKSKEKTRKSPEN
jgi:hypothetical protein